LTGFWFRKPNNNQPVHQSDLGQVLLVQWVIAFNIQSKKEQSNQQLNCIEVVQIWAEGCIGHYPIQKHVLGFGWEVVMALLYVLVLPCCSQLLG